ncbi:hypothetical protein [Methyloversatilis sp.]|uniref:hypothetical protein n=1 Tax=Methyloversatilis sp. TaxID=2569862 RepID=UPI0035AFF8EF
MSALLVILEGPQGCGKTIVAPYLAQALGCTRVHEDEPDARAVMMDLYEGRRVLVCAPTGAEWEPAEQSAPTLRISIDGDHPVRTLHDLLRALGQEKACKALQRIAMSNDSRLKYSAR